MKHKLILFCKRYSLLGLLIFCVTGAGVQADTTAFLQIPNVRGEAKEANHLNWITIDEQSLEFIRNTRLRVSTVQLAVRKRLDLSSPTLHQLCAEAKNLGKVKIELVLPGVKPFRFYQLILDNTFIESIESAAGTDRIDEFITFSCEKLSWTYSTQDVNGKSINAGAFWDLTKNLGGGTFQGALWLYGIEHSGSNAKIVWPAAEGYKYRIYGSSKVDGVYNIIQEIHASETGAIELPIHLDLPAQFYRVERVESP